MLEQEIVQHCDSIINNLNGHRRPFYPSSTDIHSPIQGERGRRPMKMPHLISPPPSFSHSSGVFNLKLNACKPCSSNSGLSKALTMRCRAMAVLPLNDSDTRWIAKSVSIFFVIIIIVCLFFGLRRQVFERPNVEWSLSAV